MISNETSIQFGGYIKDPIGMISPKGQVGKIRIESVVNEIMMTGVSYEEGEGKRLNQLIIKSNKIHTPKGVFVGIPYKEVILKGGELYRQWWNERIKLNNMWFNIEGLNATGQRALNYLTILHEKKWKPMAIISQKEDLKNITSNLMPKFLNLHTTS